MSKDISIETYISQLVKLQQSSQKITPDLLKEIALECGISQDEWNQLQQDAQNHYINGESHFKYQNYKDAISSFEKSLKIAPFHEGSLLGMSKSYQQLHQVKNLKIDKNLAINYAQNLLEVSPGHDVASRIIAQLNQKTQISFNYALVLIITFVLMAGIGLVGLSLIRSKPQPQAVSLKNQDAKAPESKEQQKLYNELIREKEIVASKWAQVSNVIQRRNDLLDRSLGLIKSTEYFEHELIDQLLAAKEKAQSIVNFEDEKALKDYLTKQKAFDQQLNKFLETLQNPALNSSKMYRDLQFQLERSENRIAIERKRYNEAVREYNTKTQQIPYNQLKFKPLPYFKVKQ